jgi:hypothetical protein
MKLRGQSFVLSFHFVKAKRKLRMAATINFNNSHSRCFSRYTPLTPSTPTNPTHHPPPSKSYLPSTITPMFNVHLRLIYHHTLIFSYI